MADLMQSAMQSASGLKAQSHRLRLVSENIANADTPGYQRKLASFEQVMHGNGAGEVKAGPVELDRSEGEKVYDPGNPLSGPDGFYQSSNVDLVVEIADAREAQRSYEANLKLFDQSRQMAKGLLELLRR